MNGFLLDTNCISELRRIKPDRGVLDWIGSVDEELLHLSVLTLGEIRKGVDTVLDSKRRIDLKIWLEVAVQSRFSGRILHINEAIAHRWGSLAAHQKRQGNHLPVIDGLLAATALHHNLALVTRNVSDFALEELSVLNPWQA